MFVHVLWAVSISLFCALPFPCPHPGHSDHSWPPPLYPETYDVSGRCHSASWSPWWPAQSCPGAIRCLLRWFLGTPCSHSSWDNRTHKVLKDYVSVSLLVREARSEGLAIEVNHGFLPHVGPQHLVCATLRENMLQTILKSVLCWLSSSKYQVSRNLSI